MFIFISGLVVFFAIHLVRTVAPGFRDAQIEKLGAKAWQGLYALISAIGFGLIIWGWMQYRLDAPEIYEPPSWGVHLTMLLVLLAFILNFAAYTPTGKIKSSVGHPMLLAVILWSSGHLLANGDLASLLLFGLFLAFSVWKMISLFRRGEPMPVFKTYMGDVLAIGVGLAGYALFFFWAHIWLFGVPVI